MWLFLKTFDFTTLCNGLQSHIIPTSLSENFKSQLNKFWFYSKMFKSGCSMNFVENALNSNDTPIFGKFLHKNITEYSEIWRDGSYLSTECYCTVFMGKTCCLDLKIEHNVFTVSLRGGWLYFHILLSVLDVGNMLTSQVNYCANSINSSHLVTCDRCDEILVSLHHQGWCDCQKFSSKCPCL